MLCATFDVNNLRRFSRFARSDKKPREFWLNKLSYAEKNFLPWLLFGYWNLCLGNAPKHLSKVVKKGEEKMSFISTNKLLYLI